jgi:hypothetical protein
MKAISMTQPWAQAMFLDLKHYETRSWQTNYRGILLIHAAKGFPQYAKEFARTERALGRGNVRLAFGAIIGKVELVNIYRTEVVAPKLTGIERLYGDYSDGRFAWEVIKPQLFAEPIPYRGQLSIFEVEEDDKIIARLYPEMADIIDLIK